VSSQVKVLPPRDGRVSLAGMSRGATAYTTLPQVKQAESAVPATGNIRPLQRGHLGRPGLFSTTIIETSRGSLRVRARYSIYIRETVRDTTIELCVVPSNTGRKQR